MKKLLKFIFTVILLAVLILFLLWAALSAAKGTEYAGNFLNKLTGGKMEAFLGRMNGWEEKGKELLQGVKEDGGKLIDKVVDSYEGLEGYDIEDATAFDRNKPIEKGNIDRTIADLDAVSLYVEVAGCTLEILNSTDGICRIQAENAGKLQAYVENDALLLRATGNAKELAEGGRILLYLPEGYSWQEASLEVDAGVIKTDCLNVESLVARCVMGNMELCLAGAVTDYNYEMECVTGSITIDGEAYGGSLVKDRKVDNDAEILVTLDCSMGEVSVVFAETL